MTPERLSYAVPPWLVAVLAAVAAGALTQAVLTDDPPGRFLFGVVGVVAAAEALRSLLVRPTLAADADGLTVASGWRREHFPWPDVVAVTVLEPPSGGGRLRRRANALEVDLGERLIVVPAYRLGAAASDVSDSLSGLRAGPG